LPPPLITTYYDPQQQTNVIEEIKLLALKGYEVYSCILEKLCSFGTDSDGESVELFIFGVVNAIIFLFRSFLIIPVPEIGHMCCKTTVSAICWQYVLNIFLLQ